MSYKTIDEIAFINPDSIRKGYPYTDIEYIDISSVGTGHLIESKSMPLSKASSRAKRLVKHKDTILSTVRPNRRSFLFIKNPKENTVVSTGFAVLRAKNGTDPRYLYYAVTDQRFTDYLTLSAKGAAYPAVDTEIVQKGKIPYWPAEIQKKISAVLAAYDDLIENNTRRIQILEEMAHRIYREWFVDFRFPRYEKAKFKSSEFGKIPEEWSVQRLGDICHIVMGQSPKSEFYNTTGQGLPFHQGVTDFNKNFPKTRTYCTVQNRLAEEGDILFSVRAPVGRINLANAKIVMGRGLCAIRSKANRQCFVLMQLKEKFKEEDTMGGGTIFKSVTKDDMHSIKMLVPPDGSILSLEEIIAPILRQLRNLTDKNEKLGASRDILLSKLISGEIDVSEMDIAIWEQSG